MNEAYVYGFMEKCAAAGVDSEALVKEAVRGAQLVKALRAARSGWGTSVIKRTPSLTSFLSPVPRTWSSTPNELSTASSLLEAITRASKATAQTPLNYNALRDALLPKHLRTDMFNTGALRSDLAGILSNLRQTQKVHRAHEAVQNARSSHFSRMLGT